MKACPVCHPEFFAAHLKETPNPVFCRGHAAHALARIFRVARDRDEDGVATVAALPAEERKAAA